MRSPAEPPGAGSRGPAASVAATAPPSLLTSPRVLRLRLSLAVAVALGWIVFLVSLAILTANPITLNRGQILSAQLVVTGRVNDAPPGTITVERHWKQESLLESLKVDNLQATGAQPGRLYILPLNRLASERFEVPPVSLPGNPPLVYPATPDALAQLRNLLAMVPPNHPE